MMTIQSANFAKSFLDCMEILAKYVKTKTVETVYMITPPALLAKINTVSTPIEIVSNALTKTAKIASP